MKKDFFAIYIGYALAMTFLLDLVCVIYIFTHTLDTTTQQMFQFMIGMFSALFGTEAVVGVINNIAKRGKEDKEVKGETNDANS